VNWSALHVVRLGLARIQPQPTDDHVSVFGSPLADFREWLDSGGSVQLVGTVLQGTKLVIHSSLKAFMVQNEFSSGSWHRI